MRIPFSPHSGSSMVASVLSSRLCLAFRRPTEQIQPRTTMRWDFSCSVSRSYPTSANIDLGSVGGLELFLLAWFFASVSLPLKESCCDIVRAKVPLEI